MTASADKIEAWDNAGLQYSFENAVAWLRLNRPQKRNAIDRPLRTALLEAIHDVSEDPDVRAAVITGNGVAFSSGADLTQEGGPIELPPDRRMGEHTPNDTRNDGILYGWYRLMERIWRSEKIFITGVNGLAAGGGCQLALAGDFIICSTEGSFWEAFVKRGLPLEGGGAWMLPKLTSLVRAKEIAILGEPLPAQTAYEWGMVNRCVSPDEFPAVLREFAEKVAAGATIRMGQIKGQINSSFEMNMDMTFREEVTLMAVGGGDDSREAMLAFRERRDAKFTGR
ncbi:MAG: enoyl-CoA hydratase/isomerase family protein [Acidimicrobiia bacterium]